eukprot:TRINITY_DN2883_c0_g1_i12.p1 TRINITY_DN2883_c0_g1~~TRINITY_DN2883_c0_g1_i12.p1  ORF type:complete len:294 (-),score=29.18 TRINITY_DN2883_c0_g1_i12:24-905(-)
MHPIESLVEDLFPLSFNRERLHIFSCGHVVPKDNLLAVSLSSGPTGAGFDLTYTHRSPQAMQELGRLVANIVNVAPDGVVVFFPSYHFEDAVISEWSRSGILARIERKKAFFREPRTSDSVEAILQAYAAKIRGDIVKATSENLMNQTLGISSSRGAVLSCVVGGKMSEGINFSDHLGRCIIVIGLPYPPPTDLALQEKLDFVKRRHGKQAAEDYYDNLCMRGVNQSIGRAIRHQNDFAAIVLVDKRYSTDRISQRLPSWIRQRLSHHAKFPSAFAALREFFKQKESVQTGIL